MIVIVIAVFVVLVNDILAVEMVFKGMSAR
jgi:hypothetical protein